LIPGAVERIGEYMAKNGLNVLAGVFKGKVDAGVQRTADLIAKKTGIDINAAAEVGGLSEDELLRLKDFELQNEQDLVHNTEAVEQLRLERDRMRYADIQSARTMQAQAIDNGDPFVRRFAYYFALLLTVLAFGFLYVVLFLPQFVTPNNRDIVNTVVGFLLGTTLSTVVGFFYGSSKGSADKSRQIEEMSSQIRMLSAQSTDV
jgi:hypothetical protein